MITVLAKSSEVQSEGEMRTLTEAIESDRENERKKKSGGSGKMENKGKQVMKNLWVNEDEETLKHHLYILLCSMVVFLQIYSIL